MKETRRKNKFICPFNDGRVCSDCFYYWEGGCCLDQNQKRKVNLCGIDQVKTSQSLKKK